MLTSVVILLFAVAIVGLAPRAPDQPAPRSRGAVWARGVDRPRGVLAIDGFSWGILGLGGATQPGADAGTVQLVLRNLQHSEFGLTFYAMAAFWIAGLDLCLAVGVARAGLVPRWAAWVFAVGVALVGTEGLVHDNVYFVVAAAVLTVGAIAMALALPDEPGPQRA